MTGISTVKAEAKDHERAPEARDAKKPAANYEQAKVRKLHWCYSTLYPISELHDPVCTQR